MKIGSRVRLLAASVGAAVLIPAAAGCTSPTLALGHRPSSRPSVPVPTSHSEWPNPFAGRVPRFPPAPVPERIALPGGAYAPIYYRVPVTQPVAFLTMDDGLVRLPQDVPLMQAAHVPFTMFLIAPVAASDPVFFRALEAAGGVVEDHTVTHPVLRGRSYAFQRQEICGAIPTLTGTFDRRPEFFRPPFGDYDQTTLKAVHDCGLRAAFWWSETVNDGKVYYQTAVHHISPGDIILMHFRPHFVDDVLAALTAIHNAGLTPALLEDYLGGDPTVPSLHG